MDPILNARKTQLASLPYSAAATVLTLVENEFADATPPYNLVIFDRAYGDAAAARKESKFEIVRVTSRSGSNYTVTRAQEGTTAIEFSAGGDWIIFMAPTKAIFDQIMSAINGKEDSFSKNTGFNKNFGSSADTVTEGNDARLSDARTPTAHSHDISDVNGLSTELSGKEPTFSKNSAFNKDFGSSDDTVTEGNDSRLSNSREWTADTVDQAEAEARTATERRAWTAQRIGQAIAAWWATITLTKADVGLTNVDNTSDATVITEARKVSITSKSASWTFSLAEGDYYRSTGASDVNATVPPNASVAYPVGTVITIRQAGNGVVTLVAGSGVTLNGDLKTAGQDKNISAVKLDTNLWDIVGGVA